MTIIEKLEDYSLSQQPIVLTIGNFDGMHRGHCAVLKKAKELAGTEGQVLVLTFRNHPSEVLRPEQPIPLLCLLPHKLKLLQKYGCNDIILLTFSRHLAQHSARYFVEYIRQFIPFSHLVLGHDATLGRDRQGDRKTMQNLAMEWGFNMYYLEEFRFEGKPVSSTRIREALATGDLETVETLLNRQYSIYGTVVKGYGQGTKLGYPTANIDIKGLCTPPFGVYTVEVEYQAEKMRGIANIGIAPTLRQDQKPILEVHLFENNLNLIGKNLEVFFQRFLRPEKSFNSPEELRQQIERDIQESLSNGS